jgi:hypothetical protein
MDRGQEKPWRRNVANVLVVNSIFAAISAIVVQTIATGDQSHYGTTWLIVGVISLVLFVVSTEQLGESLSDDDFSKYIRSSIVYNFGVLFLFIDLREIINCYANFYIYTEVIVFLVMVFVWASLWGRDSLFLIHRGQDFQRWKDSLEGREVDGDIQDHIDRLWVWMRIYSRGEPR